MRSATLAAIILTALIAIPVLAPQVGADPVIITISGKVTDGDDNPLSGITITAIGKTESNGPVNKNSTSGASGIYSLSLPPGTYNITASGTSYGTEDSHSIKLDGDRNDIDFVMTNTGTLIVNLRSNDGNITFAQVNMERVDGGGALGPEQLSHEMSLTIPGLQLGEYDVDISTILDNNEIRKHRERISIGPGENWLNRTLSGTSRISGVVMYNQAPLADVMVTVGPPGQSRSVMTGPDGSYEVTDLPAGRYTISFSKSGYRSWETMVDLDPPTYKNLGNINMDRAGLPISDGFLAGYDLPHSFMIVGLVLALVTLVFALVIRHRVRRRPELLVEDRSDT